jgi:hypothetical protein
MSGRGVIDRLFCQGRHYKGGLDIDLGARSRLVVTVNELDGWMSGWLVQYSTVPKQSRLQQDSRVNWIDIDVSVC